MYFCHSLLLHKRRFLRSYCSCSLLWPEDICPSNYWVNYGSLYRDHFRDGSLPFGRSGLGGLFECALNHFVFVEFGSFVILVVVF
jgi:hypothetical protein